MLVTTAKNWDAHVVHAAEVARGPGFQVLRERTIELAAPAAGETAVDIGAGTGPLALALAQRGATVWAVDVAPSMCEYLRPEAASARLEGIEVVPGSAVSLPARRGVRRHRRLQALLPPSL